MSHNLDDFNCICVYEHVHPRTKAVRYVGMGRPGRAYRLHVPSRSPEHLKWLYQLLQNGYSIWDIVQIKHKDLDRKTAVEIEKRLIKFYKGQGKKLFNVQHYARYAAHTSPKGTEGLYERCVERQNAWTKLDAGTN